MKNIIFLVLFTVTVSAMAMGPGQNPTAPASNHAHCQEEFPRCHLCGYATTSQTALDAHMAGHASQEHIEGEPRAGGDGPCRGADEDSATESEDDDCSQAPIIESLGRISSTGETPLMLEQAPEHAQPSEAEHARTTELRCLATTQPATLPLFGCAKLWCPYVATRGSSLTRHKHSVHAATGSFRCTWCSSSFGNRSALTLHKKTFHLATAAVPQSPMFQCDKCAFETAWNNSLVRHKQNVHSNRASFRCDQCDCSFNSQSIFTLHKRTIHATIATLSEIWRCNRCPFVTKYKWNLVTHKHTVHPGRRIFQCDECFCSFCTQAGLTRHKSALESHNNQSSGAGCTRTGTLQS